MKFSKREVPLYENRKIIRYTSGEFVITASSQGIGLEGSIEISSHEDLNSLAEYIAKAWQHYVAMGSENGLSDIKGLSVE
jgi:hypothetical protein